MPFKFLIHHCQAISKNISQPPNLGLLMHLKMSIMACDFYLSRLILHPQRNLSPPSFCILFDNPFSSFPSNRGSYLVLFVRKLFSKKWDKKLLIFIIVRLKTNDLQDMSKGFSKALRKFHLEMFSQLF